MQEVVVYSLRASSNPDEVECKVPQQVDEELIFFGPCKTRLRHRLRKRFLGPDLDRATVPSSENIYILGVNGSNPNRARKVVWAGRVSQVMTFAAADRYLRGERFQILRQDKRSSLHLSPLFEADGLVGYVRVSDLHKQRERGKEYDKWVYDLVSRPSPEVVRVEGRTLLPQRGNAWQTFDRDCCMLLENRFFAHGQGIEIDNEALEILRQAQPGKPGIDSYAISGVTSNGTGTAAEHRVDGLPGRFLTISGELADRLIAWLGLRSKEATAYQRADRDRSAERDCPRAHTAEGQLCYGEENNAGTPYTRSRGAYLGSPPREGECSRALGRGGSADDPARRPRGTRLRSLGGRQRSPRGISPVGQDVPR